MRIKIFIREILNYEKKLVDILYSFKEIFKLEKIYLASVLKTQELEINISCK